MENQRIHRKCTLGLLVSSKIDFQLTLFNLFCFILDTVHFSDRHRHLVKHRFIMLTMTRSRCARHHQRQVQSIYLIVAFICCALIDSTSINSTHQKLRHDLDSAQHCSSSYSSFPSISSIISLVSAEVDYYAELELTRTATDAQIKKSYRKLSLANHPDKNPGNEAVHAKFLAIARAYEVLSDPDKRQTYDLDGEEGLKRQTESASRGGGGGMASFFGDLFGGGGPGGPGGKRKGPDYRMDFAVHLEDLYNGASRQIKIARKILCPTCRGTGAKDGATRQCSVCKGRGSVTQLQQLGPGFNVQMQAPCAACGGKGKIAKHTCPICSGSRLTMEEKQLEAVIERGMSEGSTITFERMSEQSPDSYPGDVVLTLRTNKHSLFTRQGNDLTMTHLISLSEALLGFKHEFTHLDQRRVTIDTRSSVTQPDQVITLKGEGMPLHESPSEKGDLKVTIRVQFPQKLTEQQKQTVRELLNSNDEP